MYLVDTNILMDYPNFIKENLSNIVISEGVIGELDKLKDSIDKNKSIKARKANRELKKYWNEIKFLLEEKQYSCLSVDESLIELAKKYNYTIVSNDLPVLLYCKTKNIDCMEYHQELEQYSGFTNTNIQLDENLYSEKLEEIIQTNGEELNLKTNEFLITAGKSVDTSIIFKKEKDNSRLIPVDTHISFANNFCGRIYPKNVEQVCLMNLLFDERITILAALGKYGTGKSFLLTNYALHALAKGKINKIVYVPNNSIVENSRELGVLPGEMTDKELSYMGPILDLIGEFQARDMINRGQIEIVPLSVIRGRSFENSIILVNEAQNLTDEHIKLLIARCGEGSRIFFDGDIKQADQRVFKEKNGLELLLKLANSEKYAEIFGTVRLESIERSKTAQASEYLDNLSF